MGLKADGPVGLPSVVAVGGAALGFTEALFNRYGDHHHLTSKSDSPPASPWLDPLPHQETVARGTFGAPFPLLPGR